MKHKGYIIAVISLATLITIPYAFQSWRIRTVMRELNKADHATLLQACREMISNRELYRNDPSYRPNFDPHDNTIVLEGTLTPYGTNVPAIIRQLKPEYIVIHEDCVIVSVGIPGARLALVGFKEGAKEGGTFAYTNGLWFTNGGS